MKRPLVITALGLALAASGLRADPPGQVTAVSIVPGPGLAQVVIDVTGTVTVSDFTLANPVRIVVDISGATVVETTGRYDGVSRGGIVNVRYSQYTDDVVRVVLELESLKAYQLEHEDGAIRLSIGSDRTFAAWSSLEPRALAAAVTAPTGTPYAFEPPPAQQQGEQPRITVTYDSASVTDVMAGFAAFSGRSIVLGKGVTGVVTAEIRNQPWDVAFRSILESQGLSALEEASGIIRVDDRTVLAQRDSTEPVGTLVVPVNYARAASLANTIREAVLSSRGKVVADTATNSLIVTDVVSSLEGISDFVARLDRRTAQVSIQARLIFVDRTDIENLGVRYDLGTSQQFFNDLVQRPDPSSSQEVDIDGDGFPDGIGPTEFFSPESPPIVNLGGNALSAVANADAVISSPALQLIFSTAVGAFNLTAFVEALQQVELADLQAEPLISTLDNTAAKIQVGENTPVRQIDQGAAGENAAAVTTFVETGIILSVTPHVTSNRQVLMQISAENSAVQTGLPDVGFTFRKQLAQNQILVNDGETAVIGGLTVTEVTVTKTGIPLLVDLPIVGRIFGFTSRTERRRDLLILVTPHIIDDAGVVAGGGR